MSRIAWGTAGDRFYETGVDRGVLYVGIAAGVPWQGLISVSESPSGGEPRPFYLDGVKFLNLSAAEEFEATVTAFSSPSEFAPCDGLGAVSNGLFATNQPRKSFGLSYRTQVGNDTDGPSYAYKIHIVYNALTSPPERTNQTQGSSADPTVLSWKITTLPPVITGYKPTAHFVVDSRYTSGALLASLEDILYGTDALAARLPEAAELIALFA